MERFTPAHAGNGAHEGDASGKAVSWRAWILEELAATASIVALLYVCFAYNAIFVARVLPAVGKQDCAMLFAVAFDASWGLTFWCWLQAHMEDPGTIPPRWREFVVNVGDALSVVPSLRQWQPGMATFCEKCGILRPERTHHCAVCGVCVLRLDHHCPFIKNCVGFHNHKYFLLLLVYGALTSLIGLGTTFPELARFAAHLLRVQAGFEWEPSEVSITDAFLVLAFGVISLCFTVLFPPMVLLHVPLAAHNQTTIENSYDNMPNPYDLGTSLDNLTQILGEPGLDWLIPVRPFKPVADGVAYPRGDIEYADCSPMSARSLTAGPEPEKMWRVRYHIPVRRFGKATVLPGPSVGCGGCFA